jgi:D-serine dehydratase
VDDVINILGLGLHDVINILGLGLHDVTNILGLGLGLSSTLVLIRVVRVDLDGITTLRRMVVCIRTVYIEGECQQPTEAGNHRRVW